MVSSVPWRVREFWRTLLGAVAKPYRPERCNALAWSRRGSTRQSNQSTGRLEQSNMEPTEDAGG